MDQHLVVGFPRIEARRRLLSYEAVPFNATSTRIIASNNDLSSQEVVTKPDFVLR
jgi:hypothetical protein